MALLVRMLITSFGSRGSRVCVAPVVLEAVCSLSSPRYCSWVCDHRAFCGLWFASVSIFLGSWYAVSVSAGPWNVVYYVLWVTATKFLFVSLESIYLSLGELFPVVFLVPARVLARLPCSSRRLWDILGCVHLRLPSLVGLLCSEILALFLRTKMNLVCPLV